MGYVYEDFKCYWTGFFCFFRDKDDYEIYMGSWNKSIMLLVSREQRPTFFVEVVSSEERRLKVESANGYIKTREEDT